MDYTWIDANRKRVKLPAPQYIDYVLTWVEGLIKDESVFPTKAGMSLLRLVAASIVSCFLKLIRMALSYSFLPDPPILTAHPLTVRLTALLCLILTVPRRCPFPYSSQVASSRPTSLR